MSLKINNYVFSKNERLCSRTLIQKLFSEGKSAHSYPLKILYLPSETLAEGIDFQVLVSVPKRNFKKAVYRNRIKRLIRENFRLNKSFFATSVGSPHLLAFIFTGREMPDFQLIEKKMKRCFEKWKISEETTIITEKNSESM